MESILTIDVGNTNTKFIHFSKIKEDLHPLKIDILSNYRIQNWYLQKNKELFIFLKKKLFEYPTTVIVISSVNKKIENIIKNGFQSIKHENDYNLKTIKLIEIEFKKDTPFSFNYNPINSYGKDRFSTLFFSIKTGFPYVIIDSGTATTIDFINSQKLYMGGIIFPSVKLMLDSLHNFTCLLPQIDILNFSKQKLEKILNSIENGNNMGLSTIENMLYGCYSMYIYNIVNYLKIIYFKEIKYLSEINKLNIVFSGKNFNENFINTIKKLFIKQSSLKFINIIVENFAVNKGLKIFFDQYYN